MAPEPDNHFDTHTAAVRKWIEGLPLASTGECARQIYHALHQVNTQTLPAKQRIEFLEQVADPLKQIYPRLLKFYASSSLPLSNKSRSVLTITNAILTDLLKGFQIVIKHLLAEKPFGWKKPFAFALHRALIYYSKILCNQRLSYQPYPNGIWHQVFWCFSQAEQLGLLDKSYAHNDSVSKTSIDYEFKRLLLLSLIPPHDFNTEELQQVHNNMDLWIKNTQVLPEETDDKKTCFTINMLSDVPPYLVGTRNDRTSQTASRRYLITHDLSQLLVKYQDKLGDKDALKISRNNFLSRQTIFTLLNNWSRNNIRTEVRKRGSGFMDVVIGISAINFILNQQQQPVPAEDQLNPVEEYVPVDQASLSLMSDDSPHSKKTPPDALGLSHFISGNNDEENDVWDMVYNYPRGDKPLPPDWTESGIHTVYHFHKAEMIDFSENGYCLSLNTDDIENLRYNDLVAVREHSLSAWSLGQIKWLHINNQKQVQFGLRILSSRVLPVNVSFSAGHNNKSKPLACLIGIDDHNPILFLPNLPTSLHGKTIRLEHHEHHVRIELENLILHSPTFHAYQIHERHRHVSRSHTDKHGSHHTDEINDNVWSYL